MFVFNTIVCDRCKTGGLPLRPFIFLLLVSDTRGFKTDTNKIHE